MNKSISYFKLFAFIKMFIIRRKITRNSSKMFYLIFIRAAFRTIFVKSY